MTKKPIEHIYLPNETFKDLQSSIPNSSQIAFAYSYLYYITYLYRYCKYIDDNGNKVTQERIKEYLGYSPKNKKIDYIIKKGGLLDTIQYTETTNNYPIQFIYEQENDDLLTFETVSTYKGIIKDNNRNFKVKIPLRAFHRSTIAIDEGELNGTFYEVENTHRIDFRSFKNIIECSELGSVAFYIYGYLKHKTDIFKAGYQRSFIKIASDLSMSDKTVRKYTDILECYGFIDVERKTFDINLDNAEDHEANIYKVLI